MLLVSALTHLLFARSQCHCTLIYSCVPTNQYLVDAANVLPLIYFSSRGTLNAQPDRYSEKKKSDVWAHNSATFDVPCRAFQVSWEHKISRELCAATDSVAKVLQLMTMMRMAGAAPRSGSLQECR